MIFDYDELVQRKEGLERLLIGFRMMLNSPDIDQEERFELNEEKDKNEAELARVVAWLQATNVLVDGGYPDHKLGIASVRVIEALKKLAESAALVPQDYQAPVTLADGGKIIEVN